MSLELFQKILDILAKNPNGVPQSYLYRALGVSKAYISMVLRNMERCGMVYRVRVGNSYMVKLASKTLQISKRLKLGIVWSSEYLFLGHFAKALKDKLDMDITVNVYPSALQATLAIIMGEVDAVLSPLVTQLYAYILARNMVIVSGGAGGGAKIYEFPKSRSNTIVSSEISTMDFCRLIAGKKRIVEYEGVRYFTTPSEAIEIIKMGKARYAVLWHPLTEYIKSIEHSVVVECSEFEELKHCCTLAIARSIGIEMIEKVADIYRSAIDEFLKQPLKYLEWYSSITGIDIALLKKALNVYTYTSEIDIKSVDRVIETLNLSIPQKSIIFNAILSHI